MRKIRSFLLAFSAVGFTLLLVQCGSAGNEAATPETTLDSLEMRIQQLSDSIERLEAQTKGGEFDLGTQQALGDRVVLIEERVELLEDRVDFIDSTKFDILTRLERIETRLDEEGISPALGVQSSQQGNVGRALSDSEYEALYQQAYQLYQQQQYSQAITVFTDVIAARPSGDLSDNAQYWVGECYYGLKNFNRAVVEFEKVFTFTNSNKDDDAQLKLGLCYLNLGQQQKAREEFQRLIDFYPTSEYVNTATEYLQQL